MVLLKQQKWSETEKCQNDRARERMVVTVHIARDS